MSKTMFSEDILREAAAACFMNAESHREAAQLLADNRYPGQAVALAVIGVEEFAKAIVYAVAALIPSQRQDLPARINGHYAKHRVALWAESVQIMLSEGLAVLSQESGLGVSKEEQLATYLTDLARDGVRQLIGGSQNERRRYDKSARSWYEELETQLLPGSLTTPSLKDAGLYVDVLGDGELLVPDRVHGEAASEILGLGWYLDVFGTLPEAMTNGQAWDRLASWVRRAICDDEPPSKAPAEASESN